MLVRSTTDRSKADMRRIVAFEAVGVMVITLLGSALHFAYAWSGQSGWVAIFAAINESVWEHLKLAFWPAVLWSLVGALAIRGHVRNFWLGRVVAVTLPTVLIAGGYYGYTALLGHHLLLADLVLFGLSILVGQLAALTVYQLPNLGRGPARLALVVIAVGCLAFGSLSFFPPDLALFEDPAASQTD
jgi:hypothetical protein